MYTVQCTVYRMRQGRHLGRIYGSLTLTSWQPGEGAGGLTLIMPNSALYTVHYALQTVQCALNCTLQCSLFNALNTLYTDVLCRHTAQNTSEYLNTVLLSVHRTIHFTVNCTLYTIQCKTIHWVGVGGTAH